MSTGRPTVICLTPVKNEAWILNRFLQCASMWADHIIVADQNSTDGSRQIAARFPKVTLLNHTAERFDEVVGRSMLLDAARAIPTDRKRLIIALDADECLTANWQGSSEWERALQAPPGTQLCFDWVNVWPDFRTGWIPDDEKWFGVMDSGQVYQPKPIHGPRLPVSPESPAIRLNEVKVLHFQYTDWQRMLSKQRWYQAWERIQFPNKRPIAIYRQYHHMYGRNGLIPLDPVWFDGYERQGIEMRSVNTQSFYRWDEEVLEFVGQYGANTFRKVAIWDVDWNEVARQCGLPANGELKDPRSWLDRVVHDWLRRTQPKKMNPGVRAMQKVLQLAGW